MTRAGEFVSRKAALGLGVVVVLALGARGGEAAQPKTQAAPPPPPPKTAAAPPSSGDRWVAATPDEMVDAMIARARRGGPDALGALVVAAGLDDRASFGRVRAGLDAIATSTSPVADDARWLSLRHAPTPPAKSWPGYTQVAWDVAPDTDGMVKSFAILGPFRDVGGGLMRSEGPEAQGESWTDKGARYSWGAYEVAWRRTLPESASPRGVPLDLYISPRAETCTYLASKVWFAAGARPVVVHVAATGGVRLIWDGASVAVNEDTHPRLVLDRMAARIDAPAGDHLVAVKVCSGSVGDEGRVRVRFTDESSRPIAVKSSSDLSGLKLAPSAAPAAPPEEAPPKGKGTKPGKGKLGMNAGDHGARAKSSGQTSKPDIAEKPDAKKGVKDPVAPPRPVKSIDKKLAKEAARGVAEATPKMSPPQGVTVLTTSLEKALDVGPEPSIERALTASILRTLGGAEDQRSPRAPGLLDRVARSADVPADVLALAGWISPFGANRSGWLNLAFARASKEGDAQAASFAQRRLIAAHLSSHYVDWAEAGEKSEPFARAGDAEARLMRAVVKRQLGGSGFTRAAYDDLFALDKELGPKTSVAIVSELQDATSDAKESLELAKRLADMKMDGRGYRFAGQFRSVDAAAFEKAVADNMAGFASADDLIGAGRELLDAGRYAWAREVLFTATQLAPNKSGAFSGLAAARQAIAVAEKKSAAAASEDPRTAAADLVRARDLEPGDSMLKAEIAFRAGVHEGATDEVGPREVMPDERYIPKAESFLARAKANPAKKGEVSDRQLTWVRVVTYHPDKRVSQLMHYAREIVIEPRTTDELNEALPTEGDESELLLARVYRKDGTIAAPEEAGSGRGRPYVHWPELKTGDIVEVAIRSWTAGPVGRRGDAPFYFIDYVGSSDTHPVLYNEVVVDSPKESPLAIDVLNGAAEKQTKEEKDGRVVTRYAWEHPPNVPDEPFAPKMTEVLPVVVGSTFAGWNDFREWYRAAVKGFTEPDEEVRRVAEELTKGKKSRDEKLKAIFEFVADDIRYVNYTSGEWWLPNRPQELLARRQGDCDDKAMLLITLLKSIGIEASEVLVQTRYTGQPSLLRSTKTAIPMFDHGIAFLPGKGKEPGVWLDATSPESRLGPLPSMDARAVAMFVDEGDAKIIDTPASSPEEHGVDADWTIKLTPSGGADLEADEHHTGDSAFELRMALKQADARNQWVEQYLTGGWFSTVQLTGDVEFKSDLPRGQAFLKYAAHTDSFARHEGKEIAVPINELTTLTSSIAPLVKRTLPVVLPPSMAPGHQTRTMTIVAPEGYTFADLPPNGDEPGGEFGKGHVEFSRGKGKNTVVVKRSVVFDMSTIPVDKYEKWREWLQRVDGLMHRMVRLVPAETKASANGKKR